MQPAAAKSNLAREETNRNKQKNQNLASWCVCVYVCGGIKRKKNHGQIAIIIVFHHAISVIDS